MRPQMGHNYCNLGFCGWLIPWSFSLIKFRAHSSLPIIQITTQSMCLICYVCGIYKPYTLDGHSVLYTSDTEPQALGQTDITDEFRRV